MSQTLEQKMQEIFGDCKTQEEFEERITTLNNRELEIFLAYTRQQGLYEYKH